MPLCEPQTTVWSCCTMLVSRAVFVGSVTVQQPSVNSPDHPWYQHRGPGMAAYLLREVSRAVVAGVLCMGRVRFWRKQTAHRGYRGDA